MEFTNESGGGRGFLFFLFAIWGAVGLFFSGFSLAFASSLPSALSALTGGILWIGGMIFWGGLAALSATTNKWQHNAFPVYAVKPPNAEVFKDNHNGYQIRTLSNGSVEVLMSDGINSFKTWREFQRATDDQ
jgi:hypothetical protein